jgi:phage recombination protein Bet
MSAVAEFQQNKSLLVRVANKYGVDPDRMLLTLKATAFKQQGDHEVSNEQMMALLIVAEQHGLNPWTKEIYAFPDKKNGIVPVVSVDGWSRIINENAQLDGIEFHYSETLIPAGTLKGQTMACHEWIEAVIRRKDRSSPVVVREFFEEVYRPPFEGRGSNGPYSVNGPWQSHPRRMHRHKALIQGARIAFGFGGIYDQDEAERIVEATPEPIMVTATRVDPRGDTSMVSDLDEMQHVASIADILNQINKPDNTKDEYAIAAELREYEAEFLQPFPERYMRVLDTLARDGVIKKGKFKDYLKIGLDRGESHTS